MNKLDRYFGWSSFNGERFSLKDFSFQLITLVFGSILCAGVIGCSSSHTQRQEIALKSFGTNQLVEVKATTYMDQFIVRCEDGSIWEIKVSTSSDSCGKIPITYKNCLFDALYRIPPRPLPLVPPSPQILLEKEEKEEKEE